MRQGHPVGNFIDVEKHRSRQMTLLELHFGVSVPAEVPGGIHAADRIGRLGQGLLNLERRLETDAVVKREVRAKMGRQ